MKRGYILDVQQIHDDPANRVLVFGDDPRTQIRFIDMRGTRSASRLRIEYGQSNSSDGDMTACMIPVEIVQGIGKLSDREKLNLLKWLGLKE